MNRIALIYDKVRWRPSFFICTTTNIARDEWRKDILRTLSLGTPSFIWDRLKDYIEPCDCNNVIYINCTHGSEVVEYAPDEWWSYDVSERVCKFGTSMLVALQIATYMGFNPIYLLGCDLGFRPAPKVLKWNLTSRLFGKIFPKRQGDPNHFDPNYGTPGLSAGLLNTNMQAAHELTLRATKKIGVNIQNATIGGELAIYPRVDLFHLLG